MNNKKGMQAFPPEADQPLAEACFKNQRILKISKKQSKIEIGIDI